MKKSFLALIVFAMMAFTASAQLNTLLFPPISDSVAVNSAGLATNPTGISGIFSQSYLVKADDDTAFTATTTVSTGSYPFWRRIYGLRGSTDYEVRSVVNKNGVSDTSSSRFFTTKDSVAPQPMSITNILLNPGVFQTVVMFHYRAIGDYKMDVNFWYQSYQYSTNALRLTGEGDTSIVVTSPNAPSTLYANNFLYAATVGVIPGINPDSFFVVSNYTTPGAQSSDVEYATITAVGQDSLVLTASIKTGNTGSSVVKMDFLNAANIVTQTLPLFTITHDTIVTWKKTNLTTFTDNAFRVKAASSGGTDSVQTPFTRTLQVPLVSITSADTTLAGFSKTKLLITINTQGTWPASTTKFWATWVDSLNVNRTTDTIFGISGIQTVTSSMLDKLFENPQFNFVMLYASNGAGTISQQMQYKLPARKAGFMPQWGAATASGFTSASLSGITYSISSGTTGKAFVKRTKISPTTGTPVMILLGANLTGNGMLSANVQTGLDTGATYTFELLGASQDNDTLANTDVRTVTTVAVKSPKIGSFVTTVIYVDSVKAVSVDTVGNTGSMLLEYALCDSNEVILYQWPNTVGTTTGSYAKSKTGLQPGTKYVFKHKVSAANAATDTDRITFYTLGVPNTSVTHTQTKTKTTIDVNFTLTTNGTWAGSVADSLVLFDGTTLVAAVKQPIGTLTSGNYLVQIDSLDPGTPHALSGYVKNVFGGITPITTFTVTTDPIALAGDPSWGYLQQEGPTKISLNQATFTTPSGTVQEYLVAKRKTLPNTTSWDTLVVESGLTASSGTLGKKTMGGLDPTSRYEFQLMLRSQDGDIKANATINWENTMVPQQPKINDVTTDQINLNTVNGEVIGQANGTDAEESHKLFQITGGNPNQLASSNVVPVGMDDFTVAYSFPLPGTGYYEVRGKVAALGDINPYGLSEFFNNTALGVEEVSFDEIRPMLISSAYDKQGRLLASGKFPAELMDMFPGMDLLITPDDAYYLATKKGKLYLKK
jgi:hypothetical protein